MSSKLKLIVAMTAGRSGSSMICGILACHGAWTGPVKSGDWRNPDGFYENMDIYRACARYGQFKKEDENGVSESDGKWKNQFIEIIKAQGFKGGVAIVKHIPNCYPIWDELDPIYCTIRRDVNAQMKSREKIKKPLDLGAVIGRENCMNFLEKRGAVRIDSEKVIKGDYSQIEKVCKKAGLEFDEKICRGFVNPSYWHY